MKKLFIIIITVFFTVVSYGRITDTNRNVSEEIKLNDPYTKEDNAFIRIILPLKVFIVRESKELLILNQNIEGFKLKISGKEHTNIINIGESIIDLSGYLPGNYTIEFTDSKGDNHWIGTFKL